MMRPKILIVGRVAWTTEHSTLCSIFKDYPADKLAYICIESKSPDLSICAHHLQLSEILLAKNIVKKSLPVATIRYRNQVDEISNRLEKNEGKVGGWFRRHRSILFLYLREILWLIGRWKGQPLKKFIEDFDPDYLFFLSDPLPLINRIENHILDITNKPAALFMMDDIWSYKNGRTIYRYLLRRQVKTLIPRCKTHFAISELMKHEYDKIFDIDSIILTKGINADFAKYKPFRSYPIKFVYVGQLIYGRDKTLLRVAEVLNKINSRSTLKAELHVYTPTHLSPEYIKQFKNCRNTIFHRPVPYNDVEQILLDSNVVLFVESLEKKHRNIAWLSFSTKITDYLQCARCIFAIGDANIAPIAYLNENEAAITCDSLNQIEEKIIELVKNPQMIDYFAEKAYHLGKNKHSSDLMRKRFNKMFEILSQEG